MTEWKSYPLGELCSLRAGVAFKTADQGNASGEFPFIKVSDMNLSQNSIAIRDANNWVDSDYIKRPKAKIFPVGTVVFAKIGEALKHNRVRQIVRPTLIDNNMMGAIPNPEVVQRKFLYYMLSSFDIASTATGTALPYLTVSVLERQRFLVPPLGIQRRIASILSAYDDLIENNTRRIAILEEMARRIYEEWFVRFRFPGHEQVKMVESELGLIPEGWKVVAASDAITISPKVRVPKEGLKPFVPMGSLSENSMLIAGIEEREGNSGSKFQNGDTLFARITPCLENGKTGFVQFLPSHDAVAFGSTEFIVLRSRTLCPEYVYALARSDEFRANAIKSMSGATGRQRVKEACFDAFLLAQPDAETLQRYREIAQPMFAMIRKLAAKNANLRATRDLLLPKLISGELDVSTLSEPTV